MNIALVSALTNALDKAFEDTICSQSWFGYGDVLFMGFGSEVLSPPAPGKPHLLPNYELQTHYSDWFIEQVDSAPVEDATRRYQPTEAAAMLVGCRVTRWELDDLSLDLAVYFDNGVHVTSLPGSRINCLTRNGIQILGRYACQTEHIFPSLALALSPLMLAVTFSRVHAAHGSSAGRRSINGALERRQRQADNGHQADLRTA